MVYKCNYFGIKELVSPVVYNTWGEKAWMFFEESVLKDLDLIRETWKSEIIINNWGVGGQLKQCGLRSNMDEICKLKSLKKELYLSGHTMGKAFDLHDKLGRNLRLYDHVLKLLKQGKLTSFKRLEDWNKTYTSGGWVHVDSFQRINSSDYVF